MFPSSSSSSSPLLRISSDGRALACEDGSPFFWLADTAWQLLHRLDRRETLVYLENRAQKGFNVIQTVALAELGGLDEPSAAGPLVLTDGDPGRPNAAYFDHVEWVLREANRRGLYLALLPAWGSYVGDETWDHDQVVFTEEAAGAYGRYLGERFAHASGLIWALGGDRPCRRAETLAKWRALADAIRSAGARQLMTWHPPGGCSSSEFVHEESWLDFNMIQSSHFRLSQENWRKIERDRRREPPKPTLDAEPCYEEMPVGFNPRNGLFFDAYEVRKAAYWSVFAGGCGFTYGCQAVWQMWTKDRQPRCGSVLRSWQDSLDLPGACQVRHLKQLMESRLPSCLTPRQDLLVCRWPADLGSSNHVAILGCSPSADATPSSLLVYTPLAPLGWSINTAELPSGSLKLSAFDPRSGEKECLGELSNDGEMKLPSRDSGPDWVYLIESSGS